MAGRDAIFERLKRNPFLRGLYKFPAAAGMYHFFLSWLGAAAYGFPSREVKVIGITGTKGKTTAVEMLSAILSATGAKTAHLSSVSMKVGDYVEKNRMGNSMPGRFFIKEFLSKARRAGCTYAVVEVTSQGVLMHRHRFIRWFAAGLTNIAPEHIEAHGSFENYRASKLAFLAAAADQGGKVFINADDTPSLFFTENIKVAAVIKYSAKDLPHLPSSAANVLPGRFNLENIALVRAIALYLGVSEKDFSAALAGFRGVPGRAEFVQREPFAVVVDYAHTPDSLRAIYETLRSKLSAPNSKLICVLGAAGGGRDRWKRPEMGKAAAKYCDEIILTDEDPYDEDPGRILAEVKSGISNTQFPISKVSEILDRGEAIREAVRRAGAGDAVVITGKGSEELIHIAHGKIIPWSDKVAAEKALRSSE